MRKSVDKLSGRELLAIHFLYNRKIKRAVQTNPVKPLGTYFGAPSKARRGTFGKRNLVNGRKKSFKKRGFIRARKRSFRKRDLIRAVEKSFRKRGFPNIVKFLCKCLVGNRSGIKFAKFFTETGH